MLMDLNLNVKLIRLRVSHNRINKICNNKE